MSDQTTTMQCPKCPGTLEPRTYGRKITVHRCTECGGLWFNQIEDIKCPEDGSLMEKTADDRQTHIWYESCPTCDGMFFDAGEFTDLKYDTLMDRVRDFVRGRRE
jgi:Zn-finger nucleic acid-binding protein